MRAALAILLLACSIATAGAGATPTQRCAATKLKAAGKAASAKADCAAKASIAGAADPTCLDKAYEKVTRAFGKAESKGGCVAVGDAATISGVLDGIGSFADTQLGDDGSTSSRKCASSRRKGTGTYVSSVFRCHAKAQVHGLPVDGECVGKARDKLSGVFDRSEASNGGNCDTAADAPAALSAMDDIIATVVALLTTGQLRTTTTTTTPPPPVCGNGVVEAGEVCDPPDFGVSCDDSCHTIVCVPPPSSCGNGVIDPGETCEPPGVDACGHDCLAAPCAAPAPGEIGVACVDDSFTTVGAGSNGSGYLVAWSGPHRPGQNDMLVRRYDGGSSALDAAAKVVTDGAPCGSHNSGPAVDVSGSDYLVTWTSSGDVPNAPTFVFTAVYARRVGGDGVLAAKLDRPDFIIPFGVCRTSVSGPAGTAGLAPATWVATWGHFDQCMGLMLAEVEGAHMDYGSGPLVQTSLPLGFEPRPPPTIIATSFAGVASRAGEALAAYRTLATPDGVTLIREIRGNWITAAGAVSSVRLSSRHKSFGDTPSVGARPAVAAAPGSFLIVWGQDASDAVTEPTEIRGMRATPAGGALDSDGGLLLATTAGGAIAGSPAVAFDGTVWLVAWIEATAGGNELRAVAVAQDGTVLDAMPRLLASGVDATSLAAASLGDGHTLVVYARPDGGASAVRARLVPGS